MGLKRQNINLIRSFWRRIKNVTGESKPITRGIGTTAHPKNGEATIYEIRPRVDGNGCNLIGDVLRFGRLWFAGPNATANAVKFAKFYSRSHDAVIRVYDEAGVVIDRHAHGAGDFKGW